jgi:hypothetical protein
MFRNYSRIYALNENKKLYFYMYITTYIIKRIPATTNLQSDH